MLKRTRVWLALGLGLLSLTAWAAPELDVVRITGQTAYPELSIQDQKRILNNLSTQAGPYGKYLSAYYLPKSDLALSILSEPMLKLLYKDNAKDSDSNCYWTSMFGTGVLGLPERYMDLPEYNALASTYFNEVTSGPYEAGDVLRLKREKGKMDTHSVIYLGTLKGDGFTHLVVSKNGPSNGPYLIMNLWDLANRVYPGSRVFHVYRRK